MKIATIINNLGVGGAEVGLLRVIESTQQDFDHIVFSLVSGGELIPQFEALGVPVVQCGFLRGRASAGSVLQLRRDIASAKPDLLIGRMYHSAVAATLLRHVLPGRVPLLWSIHHSLNGLRSESRSTRLALQCCRLLSHKPHTIVFVSARSAEQHAAIGFPAERSVVIPNGYDLDRFHFDAAARDILRREWGFGEDDIVVGLVARVHPMKDQPNMIAALEQAMARQPRLAGVFCGPGTDELTLPSPIAKRVRLLGPRRDVPAVMSACDLGALSSSHGEAFPNILSEFMACERPCVTTDVGDAAFIVGEIGLVVPVRDSEALAEALLRVAALSSDERKALGEAGRRSIAERFSLKAVAERNMELWEAALQGVPR